ncbi:hypothetical protein K438DRAFT_1766874 [Mycena galopus ATCC 62051]|nr:hypothetical protein K438DRAFT_1766874 [Mycena galopus ATCC 62051]
MFGLSLSKHFKEGSEGGRVDYALKSTEMSVVLGLWSPYWEMNATTNGVGIGDDGGGREEKDMSHRDAVSNHSHTIPKQAVSDLLKPYCFAESGVEPFWQAAACVIRSILTTRGQPVNPQVRVRVPRCGSGSTVLYPNPYPCPTLNSTYLPPGQNQHTSYPFGPHAHFTPPWNYFSEGEHFFLRSNKCRQRVPGDEPRLCKPLFFPFGGLIKRIRKKDDQLQAMRLTKLNDTRMLAGKIAELDLHKQLMMAIATSDERRISHLIRAGLNNGESIGVMLERFYRACVDVHREGPKYNPKGFTQDDYMVGLCVLRLGGARLADILHRALGLPGLTTLRKHSVIKPLRASPAMPTIAEIEANIDAYTEGEETLAGPLRSFIVS